MHSYEGHQFIVRYSKYLDNETFNNDIAIPQNTDSVSPLWITAEAGDDDRVVIYDKINNKLILKSSEETYVSEKSDGKVNHIDIDDMRPRINEVTANCREKYYERLLDNNQKEFQTCFMSKMEADYNSLQSQVNKVKQQMSRMSFKLRNLTCDDDRLTTSTPVGSFDVLTDHQNNGFIPASHTNSLENVSIDNKKKVNILLNTSHANIWTIDEFVTQNECDTLMRHGLPRLQRATVAAEDGSSVISVHRKAQQAMYDSYHEINDPLSSLYKRVLNITHLLTGYDIPTEGQEGFTIIQYNVGDQYTPHCDASCDGQPHIPGGRVVTALFYCKVPELGGSTTFTNSNVYIKPVNRTAAFFSYKGPEFTSSGGSDNLMDPLQLTEHSGCPVRKGEKWAIALWMRIGVSRADPWTLHDPSGPLLDSEIETQS